MSRWSETDDTYHDDVPFNAQCTDCGIAYSKAEHDPTTWCDACSDKRDAHTTALEIRMAKADLEALAKRREIA